MNPANAPLQARVGAGRRWLREVSPPPLSGVGLSDRPPRGRSRWFRFLGLFPGVGGASRRGPSEPARPGRYPADPPLHAMLWSDSLPNPSVRGWSVGWAPSGRSRWFRFWVYSRVLRSPVGFSVGVKFSLRARNNKKNGPLRRTPVFFYYSLREN